jgi:inhibitor of KinA
LDAGDGALLVRFGREISEAAHARVLATLAALERARPPFVVDLVPAYASLLVIYDPTRATAAEARAFVSAALSAPIAESAAETRQLEIPVFYDPEVAPDLEPLAAEKGLSPAEVVALHAGGAYRVYALGFRPGFPFLGTVDARLAAPRLAAPRPRVAAGSVGIAGRQTGVYPGDGPGGWRIVGRTPLAIFDPSRHDAFMFHVGDRVRFVPIDRHRYRELCGANRSQL